MPGRERETGPSGDRAAANLRRLRKQKGITVPELVGRLAELGQPIAPSSVPKTETGARRMDVDDLLALSAALGVSPAALLAPETDRPGGARHRYLVTPAGPDPAGYTPAELWRWLTAEAPLPGTKDDDVRDWLAVNRPHHVDPVLLAGVSPALLTAMQAIVRQALADGATAAEIAAAADLAVTAVTEAAG